MSADTITRDAVVTERLQQLVGAIKVLQKMVGNDDQTWLAENVAEAQKNGPESAVEVYKLAIQNVHASISKCTFVLKAVEVEICLKLESWQNGA